MEKFINIDTIIKNDIYNDLKEYIICPLCFNILINPIICMKCQKVYCKNCISFWNKKNVKCPNFCNNPNYQNCFEKRDILSALYFKCTKCKNNINYDDIKNHYTIHYGNTKSAEDLNDRIEKIAPNIKRISEKEADLFKQKGKKIKNATSKINNIIF